MAGKNKLLDMSIKHSVLTQRYAASQFALLNSFIRRLEQLSLETLPKILGGSKKRLEANLVAFREAAALSFKASKQTQMEAYKTFAQYEAQVHTQILNSTKANFVIPNTAQLQQSVFSHVITFTPGNRQGKGLNIGNTLNKFGIKKTAEIVTVLRQGYALGETNNVVSQRIQEVVPMQLRQASTLTRTVTNFISSQTRQVVLQANEDIIEGYQVVATLDANSCLDCSPRDGVVMSVDEFDFPPFHYNCRCTFIPVIKQQFRSDDIESAAVRPSEGASGVELLSGKTTYSGWLRTQPASFQDEVLGVTKGKLFRITGVGLDKFVDEQYRPYTLEQLTKKDQFHTFLTNNA